MDMVYSWRPTFLLYFIESADPPCAVFSREVVKKNVTLILVQHWTHIPGVPRHGCVHCTLVMKVLQVWQSRAGYHYTQLKRYSRAQAC